MASKVSKIDRAWNKPTDAEAYRDVILCGNRISSAAIFQLKSGIEPLMIGRGTVPRVWISAPLDESRTEWGFVINDGVSLHPAFKVIKSHRSVTIHAGATLIFAAREISPVEVVVTALDLRPVGLNIFGDQQALHIGSAEISGSSIIGGAAAFGIG